MQITKPARCALSVLAVIAITMIARPESARATLQIFSAADIGVGPGAATPNSSAAAATFDTAATALGPESLINFESAPVGSFTSLLAAPTVTITGTDFFGNNQVINNSPQLAGSLAPLGGFNTTAGGSNYLDISGGTATFTFSQPTQFFGAYFTGVQPIALADTIVFSDGTSQTVNIPQNSNGGVAFVGFTDAGKSISSITINAGTVPNAGDLIGVDDVRYQGLSTSPTSGSPVPEPATTALAIAALPAIALFAITRRKLVK